MKRILLSCLAVVFTFASSAAWAQERTVSGTVTSTDDGTTLPGVNVVLKGTTTGTTTDSNGKYTLTIPAEGGSLVFTFIGLQSQEIAIGERTIVDVSLALDATQLSEVIVVGYGTQNKRDVTGAIASVKGDAIAMTPVQSFEQALGGRAAGVNVSQPNGVMNNPPVIRIRGVNSINLSSFPLIVVDGIPTFSGDNSANNAPNNPLSNINPADIESIEVLKDAAAGAIYGSRSAAGVLLITTKRGKKGKSQITFDSWVGWTEPFRLFDMMNAEQYMMLKNEAVRNLNQNNIAHGGPGNAVEGFRYPLDGNGNPIVTDTKWYDYVYRTGFSHSNSLSFSGASDKTSYYMSVGYTDQEGMLKKNNFDRTSVRLNIDHKVFDRFKVGANISYANVFNSAPSTGSLPGSAFSTAGLGRLPLVLPPNVNPYNADGTFHVSGAGLGPGGNLNPTSTTGGTLVTGYYNPALVLAKDNFTSESNQIQGSIWASWEIVKGLTLRTSYGIDQMSFEDISFQSSLGGDGYSTGGSAANAYRTNKRWNWQNTAQYDVVLADKHSISLLVGGEQQYTQVSRWGATRTVVADNFFETYQGNFTNISVSANAQTDNYLLSYFGRLNYDFNKKYFASVNFRRDGFSAWGNKWGNFYGASVGYAISEEGFWKDNSFLSNIDMFKIRGSYGEVGNSNGVADYGYLNLYGSGLYAGLGTIGYSQAGNSDLSWETSKKTDLGFDFALLDGRIEGEFSYYKNLIDGLILAVQQAPSKGVPGDAILSNIGSMQNTGIEIGVKVKAINKGKFNWTTSLNFTTLKNEVLTLNSESTRIPNTTLGLETVNYTSVGQTIGYLLAVESVGINPANGRRMFRKADGTIVQYDHGGDGWTRVDDNSSVTAPNQLTDGKIYGPTVPKYYGGFDNTFRYGNIDLGVFFQFSGGNYMYNGTKAGLRDMRFWNNHTDVLDRWTPENPNGSIPRVVYGDNVSNGSALVISENVEKADFIRLRNVSLGYTFNKDLMNKLKIGSARIYGQIQNAFVITGYEGIDPENSANGNSTTGAGVDRNSVGQARTYTIGLNLTF